MRRTENALAEAIRFRRAYGGKRYIKDGVTKFTSSRRNAPFVDLNVEKYKEKCRIGGTRRF